MPCGKKRTAEVCVTDTNHRSHQYQSVKKYLGLSVFMTSNYPTVVRLCDSQTHHFIKKFP